MRSDRIVPLALASILACVFLVLGNAAERPASPGANSANATTNSTNATNAVAAGSALPVPFLAVADMASLDAFQHLGKGDRVSFRVIEDEEDPKSLTVTDAGDIEVPYYGLVRAEGKSCRQLAMETKELLEKSYYFQATVIIAVDLINKTRVLGKVYVTGQVRTPGSQELLATDANTVSKAILKAGGFSDFADKRKVQIVRDSGEGGGGKKIYTVNVSDIWQKGQTDLDIVLQPEDTIFVPARLVNF